MINLRPVMFVVGSLLTVLGLTMSVPALVDLFSAKPTEWPAFLGAMATTLFIGSALAFANRAKRPEFTIKQAFLMTVLSWTMLTAFSALPFWFSTQNTSYTDAFFEAMSGLTTTGATVMTKLDQLPYAINLWRGLLQWLGGLGIIVMAIAVLPMLQVGGMQLFKVEAFETTDKILPRATQISGVLVLVYVALTFICLAAYAIAGMKFTDAVMHSMTTVATGGFSSYDASFAAFQSTTIELICIVFMILGSLPFLLYVRAVQGNPMALVKDSQVRWFFSFAAIFVALGWASQGNITAIGWPQLEGSAFNVISIMTGTGYATTDYTTWSFFAVVLFFFVMFVGGCAGSTSCGIKIFRFQIVYQTIRTRILTFAQPNRVVVPYYNGAPMPDTVSGSVMSFLFLFILSFFVSAALVNATGVDIVTSLSTAASALANVGPALGNIAGPAGTYQPLNDTAKWILSFTMLLGRLELFTVLVLFMPAFWRT